MKNEFGNKTKQRMFELGLNREELAKRMKVSPSRISQMLNQNNMQIKTLTQLAFALDKTPIKYFF